MVASNVTEVLNEIVTVLRANMTDPLAHRIRKGEDWIISKFPTYSPETPYIKVSHVDSPNFEHIGIGSLGYKQEAIFQVTIASREGEELDINDDDVKEKCAEITEYFATQIINITKNNLAEFTKSWRIRATAQRPLIQKGFYYLVLDLRVLIER